MPSLCLECLGTSKRRCLVGSWRFRSEGVLGMIWEGDTHLKADILSMEPEVIGKNVNAHRDYEGWEDK